MPIWKLWRRSRGLAIGVGLLLVLAVANAIYMALRPATSFELLPTGMAAGAVIGIIWTAAVLERP